MALGFWYVVLDRKWGEERCGLSLRFYLLYGSGTLCKGISRRTDSNTDSLGRPVLEGFLLRYPAWVADTDRGHRQPLETDTSTEWAGKQERAWTRVTCVVSKIHWFNGLYSKIYIWCNTRYLVMSGRKNCELQGRRYIFRTVGLMSVIMQYALF